MAKAKKHSIPFDKGYIDIDLHEYLSRELDKIWNECRNIDKVWIFELFIFGGSKTQMVNYLYGKSRGDYELVVRELQSSQRHLVKEVLKGKDDFETKMITYLKEYLDMKNEPNTAQNSHYDEEDSTVDKLWKSLSPLDKSFIIRFFLLGGSKTNMILWLYKENRKHEYTELLRELKNIQRRLISNQYFSKEILKNFIINYLSPIL